MSSISSLRPRTLRSCFGNSPLLVSTSRIKKKKGPRETLDHFEDICQLVYKLRVYLHVAVLNVRVGSFLFLDN